MALMVSKGEACDRMPDCAIFAGTRWEPPSVYERVEWLAEQFRFLLHVAAAVATCRPSSPASAPAAMWMSPSTRRDLCVNRSQKQRITANDLNGPSP